MKNWLLFLLLLGLFFGCKAPRSAEKTADAGSSFDAFLAKYEKTFDPSKYNLPVDSIVARERQQHNVMEAAKIITVAAPETIPGFRVQVLFTPEIERANLTRDSLLLILPGEWSYVVYDAPYYKVRVGNFNDRGIASQMVSKLVSFGFQDAWIVPDKIIKNPPPRIPEEIIIPDSGPDQR
jgi:hypothetical protein